MLCDLSDRCFFSPWDEVLTPQFSLKDAIERSHSVEVLTKEIEALKKKIDREKQFKKRLEPSGILKPKEEELTELMKLYVSNFKLF